MTRPSTPDVRITEALQPAAAVVNVGFAHPAPQGPSPLHGVAQALESLSSDLMAWGKKEQERQKEEDAIRGEALYQQHYADGIAEGIRTDQIPPNSSREFVNGYKRAMGSSAGFQFSTSIENEYAKSNLKTNPDPKAFDAWLRDQWKNRVTSDDPSVLRGVLPHIRQLHSNLYNKWQADVAQNTKYEALSSYGALAGSTIDAYNAEGLRNYAVTDLDGLGSTLDQIRDKGFATGLKREEIDQAMVDAITSKALTHRDPQLLKLLDRESAAGPKLSDTPYGRDKKAEAVKSLTSLFKQQTTEERLQQERDDKLAANTAKSRIADRLLKDPNAEISDDDLAPILKHDGNFKLDLLTWRKNVREGQIAEEPAKVQQVFEDLLKGGGEDTFWKAITSGTIKSPESMSRARSFMDIAAKNKAAPSKILETSAARSYVGNIEMLGQDSIFSKQSIMGVKAMTAGGREALNNYRYGLMKWQHDNPNATPLEQEEYAAKFGETIIKGLQASGEQGEYVKPAAVQKRIGDSPQAIPEPLTPEQARQLGRFNTPEDIEKVEAFAAKNNLTPQQAVEKLGRSMMKQYLPLPTGTMPPVQPLDTSSSVPDITASPPAQDMQAIIQGVTEYLQRNLPATMLPPSARAMVAPPVPMPPVQPMDDAPSTPASDQRTNGPRTSIDLPGGLGQIHLANISPENAEMVRSAVANLNLWGGSPRPQAQSQVASLGDQPTMPTINGKPVNSHLDLAKSLLGKNETDDRKALVAFFKSSMGSSINPATTPWCARFANAVLAASGQKGTGSDMARSFLNYGTKVDPAKAKPGDIIVFPRGSSKVFGHVGFVESVNAKDGTVRVLGGNQGGSAQKGGGVTVQSFPLSRALGVRRVTTQTVAALMADGNTAFA